jgi:hypothetical protein
LRSDYSHIETISYRRLLREFSQASATSAPHGEQLFDYALKVFGGAEPPAKLEIPGTKRSGDHIFKALKWIWAQEDSNYPIPDYEGRKLSVYRLQELRDGVPLQKVIERASVKWIRVANDMPRVNYAAVDQAL